MTTHKSSIEQKLLLAAEAGDLPTILDIVSRLTINERESVNSNIFDTALHSIVQHASIDQAESAYTTMMFIRAVGRYISPEAVSAALQSAPPASHVPQRRYTDNVYQLRPHAATYELSDAALRRRGSDHEAH